mgnify:CR=1 FL=1
MIKHVITGRWQTLAEMLAHYAEAAGERVFIRAFEKDRVVEELTYEGAWQLALRWAALLRAQGVGAGTPVILALPNGVDFIGAYFGTLAMGGVPASAAPLRHILNEDAYVRRIAERARFVRAGAVIVPPAQAELGTLPDIAATGAVVLTREQLPGDGPDLLRVGSPEEVGLMQFTSGTSGKSKAVLLSHRALFANIQMIARGLQLTNNDDDSALSWLPLFHDMGLIGYILTPAALAGTVNLMQTEDFMMRPALWMRLLSETKATITGAPPSALSITARRTKDAEVAALDLRHVRVILVGAEQVNIESVELFAERFAPAGLRKFALMPTYGMAENCLAVTMPTPGDEPTFDTLDLKALAEGRVVRVSAGGDGTLSRAFALLGHPMGGVKIKIVDENGQTLGVDQVGEVVLHSPSVMSGYYQQPEETTAVLRDGWLYTGDLGYLRADGQLVMTGRKKEVLIVGGRNYYPDDIEEVVARVEGVRMGANVAFSYFDPERTTEAIAVVAETGLSDPAARDALVLQIRKVVSGAGFPVSTVVLAPGKAIKSTANGKLMRFDTRERFLAGEFGPVAVGVR